MPTQCMRASLWVLQRARYCQPPQCIHPVPDTYHHSSLLPSSSSTAPQRLLRLQSMKNGCQSHTSKDLPTLNCDWVHLEDVVDWCCSQECRKSILNDVSHSFPYPLPVWLQQEIVKMHFTVVCVDKGSELLRNLVVIFLFYRFWFNNSSTLRKSNQKQFKSSLLKNYETLEI